MLVQFATFVISIKASHTGEINVSEMGIGTQFAIVLVVCLVMLFLLNSAALTRYKMDCFCKVCIMLLVYMLIGALFTMISYGSMYAARAICFPGLNIFAALAFYCMGRNMPGNISYMSTLYFVFIVLAVPVFFSVYGSMYMYTNNIVVQEAYFMLLAFPLLLAHKLKIIRYIAIFLVSLVTIYSSKRGGFICVFAGIFAYFLIQNVVIEKRFKTFYIISIPFTLAGIMAFMYYYIVRSGEFVMERISNIGTDQGSGRIDIWLQYIALLKKNSIIETIFGHGYYGCLSDFGTFANAHCDFIESFYEFGIIGFLLFISLLYMIVKKLMGLIRERSVYAPSFACACVIYLALSSVSILYGSYTWGMPIYIYIGMLFACTSKDLPANMQPILQ